MADAPENDVGTKRRRTDDEGGGGGGDAPAPPRDGEAAAVGAADAAQPEMTDRERCERMREELAVVLATRDAVRVKSIAENHRMKAELAHRAARGEESLKLYENTRKVIDNMKRYIIDRERQVASLKKLVAEKQDDLARFRTELDEAFGPEGLVKLVITLRGEVAATKEEKAQLEKECVALSSGRPPAGAPGAAADGAAPAGPPPADVEAAPGASDGAAAAAGVPELPFDASPERSANEEEVDRLIEDLCPGPAVVCA